MLFLRKKIRILHQAPLNWEYNDFDRLFQLFLKSPHIRHSNNCLYQVCFLCLIWRLASWKDNFQLEAGPDVFLLLSSRFAFRPQITSFSLQALTQPLGMRMHHCFYRPWLFCYVVMSPRNLRTSAIVVATCCFRLPCTSFPLGTAPPGPV